jgi:cytochrome c
MKTLVLRAALVVASVVALPAAANEALAAKYTCSACHSADKKVVGPAWKDVATKYRGDAEATGRLETKVRVGGSGIWGATPMPGYPTVPDADVKTLVAWVLTTPSATRTR